MNEVNFVPIRILIKKNKYHSIIKRLIILSSLLFIIPISIYVPVKVLKATHIREIAAFKYYRAYQNKLSIINKNKAKYVDKLQEVEKGRVKIGAIIRSINAINIENLLIININYESSDLLIKGSSGDFNAIINFGKVVKSISSIKSANLIEIEFDKVNGVYNFNYKVTP